MKVVLLHQVLGYVRWARVVCARRGRLHVRTRMGTRAVVCARSGRGLGPSRHWRVVGVALSERRARA